MGGLNRLVSVSLLSLFSWGDLQLLIAGNPIIDIDALKRHTKLGGGYTDGDPSVRYFWKALHSFSNDERKLFLRFVWGRSRLPLSDSEWGQVFTLTVLTNADDGTLPVAHTCFFTLDLPRYTTYEITRTKILYAIINSRSIDLDFNTDPNAAGVWAT